MPDGKNPTGRQGRDAPGRVAGACALAIADHTTLIGGGVASWIQFTCRGDDLRVLGAADAGHGDRR